MEGIMKYIFEHSGFGETHSLAREEHFVSCARIRILRVGYVDHRKPLEEQGYEIEVIERTEQGMIRYRFVGRKEREGEVPSVPLKNLLRPTESICLVRRDVLKETLAEVVSIRCLVA